MAEVKNLVGQKFNYLEVIKRVENNKYGRAQWLCQCKCGNTTVLTCSALLYGRTKSCGCKIYESHNKRHGLTGSDIHKKWSSMRQRCNDSHCRAFKFYGAKGIKVCPEWSSFESFYEWSIEHGYREGLSLDRINPRGNYEPANCRWIPLSEQANNRTSNKAFTYHGKTQNLMQWCKEFGKEDKYAVIHNRIFKYHYTFEQAMFSDRYEFRGKL